jgi:hypothetical protein
MSGLKQLKNVNAVKINNQLNEAKYNLNLIINAKRTLKNIARKIYIFRHDIHSQVKKRKRQEVDNVYIKMAFVHSLKRFLMITNNNWKKKLHHKIELQVKYNL